MKQLLNFCFIIFLYNCFGQQVYLEPKLENIKWISGTWHGEALGGAVEEIWSVPSGGSMMATFKLTKDNAVVFYEIEIIRETENSLVLQLKHFDNQLRGWEQKEETVDFPLKYITPSEVAFEGMTFEKLNDHEMNVHVAIEEQGKVETMTFNYKKQTPKPIKQLIKVKCSETNPKIDGLANESIWDEVKWHAIDQLWLGAPVSKSDFSGRYKLTWTKEALYLLAEITDDHLVDNHKDPLINWWDDDCLEIFVDEDNSGGEHQYNHNAFAYHVALDGNVVDMSPQKKGSLYNEHIVSKRQTQGHITLWEAKILLFKDSYKDGLPHQARELNLHDNIGFALAYCDNDKSEHREHFIGSVAVEGENKNKGWIDAHIFGTLLLVD